MISNHVSTFQTRLCLPKQGYRFRRWFSTRMPWICLWVCSDNATRVFRSGRTCFWAMWRACRKMCSCVAWSQYSFRGYLCDCIPPTKLWLWVRPFPGWSRSSWWSASCQSWSSNGCTVFAHWCRGHGARWAQSNIPVSWHLGHRLQAISILSLNARSQLTEAENGSSDEYVSTLSLSNISSVKSGMMLYLRYESNEWSEHGRLIDAYISQSRPSGVFHRLPVSCTMRICLCCCLI